METNEKKYADVMNDTAVTNISGWTETDSDTPFDEQAYRERLEKNAPILQQKIAEALASISRKSTKI